MDACDGNSAVTGRPTPTPARHARRRLLALGLLLIAAPVLSAAEWLQVPGGRVEVHWDAQLDAEARDKLSQWLRHAGQATALLDGAFPVPHSRVQVRASRRGSSPVPWAKVERGSPPQVLFEVRADRSLDAFLRDWVAVHEFSHLFLPFPGNDHIWFSEGLATYYQNVLRARAGVLGSRELWQRLEAGFQRGLDDSRYRRLSLEALSPRMWRTRSYMRVYWSGVAYFLDVDVALRRQSDGQVSLDTVISRYNACCRDGGRVRLEQLLRDLDAQAEGTIFSDRLPRALASHSVPDVAAAYAWLGLRRTDAGLRFDQQPRYVERRAAIGRAPAGALPLAPTR